jgi:hypothetical protein
MELKIDISLFFAPIPIFVFRQMAAVVENSPEF